MEPGRRCSRVPTIEDLYAAPVNTSVTFNDPCTALTAAKLAANPNLATGLSGCDSGFGLQGAERPDHRPQSRQPRPCKPETGTVKTVGIVFDPSFLPGFSIDIDYWKYDLTKVITLLDSNYSINQCVATGSPYFLRLRQRFLSGAQQPVRSKCFRIRPRTWARSATDGVDLVDSYSCATRRSAASNSRPISRTR